MLYNTYKYDKGKYETADLEEGLSAITSTVTTTVSSTVTYNVSISLSAASSTSCNAIRIQKNDANVSATSTITLNVERVRDAESSRTVYGTASITAVTVVVAQASDSSACGFVAACNRIQSSDMNSTSCNATFNADAREKWIPISEGSEIWTELVA